MNFRAKLALGFAGILALLLVAASYASLRNVDHLSARLSSSYADSVLPLRHAQVADEAFNNLRLNLVLAVLQQGAVRDQALAQFETDRVRFEEAFAAYVQRATHEPAMQEVLAKYGAREDIDDQMDLAIKQVKRDYPILKTRLAKVEALLRAGNQRAAARAYKQMTPLFTEIDRATDVLMGVEVKEGKYLDKESQVVAKAANQQIPLIAGIAMVSGALLVLIVARSVTEPLLRLTAAAQKVSAGDLDQVVKVESHDEVGQLAQAFNSMTESLRAARAELEDRVEARTRELAATNELLNAQVAERERARHALEQAKDAAESANRAKSEFLAKMSHELRTPLNGVIGAVELVFNTDLGPEQREYLQIAHTAADGLLQVINDILDFSRAESGKVHFEDVDFNLRHTLQDALTTLSIRAAEKPLELTCHVSPELPEMLVGDPGRLRQVVLNLVGNAIKFTERGQVSVGVQLETLTDREVNLHFSISDTGMGIASEHRAQIFAPFEQGDGSITRRYGGTGLGLAISAQLIDIMGGTIWVDSEVDKGSTFHFTARFGVSASASPTLLPKRLAHFQGRRVLIADDDGNNRGEIEQALAQWGMIPAGVASGQAALTALEDVRNGMAAPFDLVLMDCKFAGAMALAEYVKSPFGLNVPIVLMVAPVEDAVNAAEYCPTSPMSQIPCFGCNDRAQYQKLGIAHYLAKPVRQAQLLDALVNTLAVSRLPVLSPNTVQEPRLRILIAEDNIINQKIVMRALERWGHWVDVANNGREALVKLDQQPFDLVLMDLQMPEMDGFQTTRAIREREKTSARRVPIIAVTAHAMYGDSERCFQAGMDSYVSKPLQLQELYEEIHALTGPYGQSAAGADTAALPPEVIQAFLADTPKQLSKLQAAAQEQDTATLKSVAHYLKGSAMYVGAHRMTELCKDIELSAVQDLPRVVLTVAQLEAEVACVRAILECRAVTANCE